MFSDSDVDSDYIDKRPQPDVEFLYYKPPPTTTTTTTKARKRQKSHNEQINSDDDVIEIKRPDVEIIHYKSPPPPTTTTKTTTRKKSKYTSEYLRTGYIAQFLEAFEFLPNRTNNRYNINKQLLEEYNFRGGVTNSIVFNCKTPSVISLSRTKRSLTNIHILEKLKKIAFCDSLTPNGTLDKNSVWLENGKSDSPVIFTCVNRNICEDNDDFLFKFPYPVSYLIDYFIDFNMCELFLKYLGHPYYYSYSDVKPTLCDRKIF